MNSEEAAARIAFWGRVAQTGYLVGEARTLSGEDEATTFSPAEQARIQETEKRRE
jgi:hypothetical protein